MMMCVDKESSISMRNEDQRDIQDDLNVLDNDEVQQTEEDSIAIHRTKREKAGTGVDRLMIDTFKGKSYQNKEHDYIVMLNVLTRSCKPY